MSTKSLKEKLKNEGFKHVYIWKDKPGKSYPPHKHKGEVSLYITAGSITFYLGKKKVRLTRSDRLIVPVGKKHSATVGPRGCSMVVGEMIKGDS